MSTTPTPVAELVAINPAKLALTANIRSSSDLDPTFLASIKDHGVLVPIVARRDAEDTLTVLYGHRRTAAAVAASLPTVPVMIVDTDTDTESGQDSAAQIVKRTKAGLAEVDAALAVAKPPPRTPLWPIHS
jgi:ParB family chromosome partitioning protein